MTNELKAKIQKLIKEYNPGDPTSLYATYLAIWVAFTDAGYKSTVDHVPSRAGTHNTVRS